MIRQVLAIGALALFAVACTTAPRYGAGPAGDSRDIRVLLDQTRGDVTVRATGPFTVQGPGGARVASGDGGVVTASLQGNTIQMRLDPPGSVAAVEDEVWLVPQDATEFEVGGVRYAGRVRMTAWGQSLMVVNVIALEHYLEGVVPHEIGDPGPDAYAAVQAQAITARTYSMTRMAEREREPFDVYSGVRDQVYRGTQGGNRLAASAVRETRGLVLAVGGGLVRTYYSATCGGHTSDIRRVWPKREAAPYLFGRRDRGDRGDPFCSWTGKFRWRFSFSGHELGDILRVTIPRELGVPADGVGYLVDLHIVERSPSGRVRVLEIETTRGRYRVEGDRIRWVLMIDPAAGRILPSTLFDIEKTGGGDGLAVVSIVGGGNGHGVGMCQNGAIGMARRGYSYRMILSHYYPGTEVSGR